MLRADVARFARLEARSERLLDAAALALIAVVAVAIGIVHLPHGYDDAYITFRYARNFAQGNGFVYNVGERFIGTTAPLYALILGVLAMPAPDAVPLISGVLSLLSMVAAGAGLYVYGKLNDRPLAGFLAAVFYAANPIVQLTYGGEMPFQLALIVWSFVLYRRNRTVWASALVAVATLTRPDGIIAAGVLGVHFLITRRRFPIREALTMLAIIAPFMIAMLALYGTAIPGTLAAKRAQGTTERWTPFVTGSIDWLRGTTMQGTARIFPGIAAAPNQIRFIYFVVAGIPMTLLFFRFWLLPLSWIGLYMLGYHLLNVPFYHWYLLPIVLGLSILAGSGVAGVVEAARRVLARALGGKLPHWTGAALAVLAVLVLAPGILAQVRWSRDRALLEPTIGELAYTKLGRWLDANTPPDASVGYLEIGYVGYYANRRFIDQLGLVNAGVAQHVANNEMAWAYEHFRPDYIVRNPTFDSLIDFTEIDWFNAEYRQIALVSEGPLELLIYRREAAGRQRDPTVSTPPASPRDADRLTIGPCGCSWIL